MHTHDSSCFSIGGVAKKAYANLTVAYRSDAGFAGYTHALSGLAVGVWFFALAPMFMDLDLIMVGAIGTAVAFLWALIGATLVPDFDNTSSTSRNSLGLLGVVISTVFRSTSVAIQTVVRTSKDESGANPHRGFWHSGISALLLGVGVYFLSKISYSFTVPAVGEVTVGQTGAFFVFFMLVHFTLSALAKKAMYKLKKSSFAGELIAILASLSVSALFFAVANTENFIWLAVAMTGGCLVHMFGDSFTKDGLPFWFPICVVFRGKFWWKSRLMKLTSGDDFEKGPITYLLYGITAVGIVMLALRYLAPQGI